MTEHRVLTAYFGERDRCHGRLLADELVDAFAELGIQASAVLRGSEGFGRLHHLHTDRLLSLSEDLPVQVLAVDRADRIDAALQAVRTRMQRGLITVERTRLLGEGSARESPGDGEAKLTVWLGRHERAAGHPAHLAACAALRRHGFAGATVLLGVDGTRRGARHRARLLGGNVGVPTLVTAVGDAGAARAALGELPGLLGDPLITLERVRVCKRDGERLAEPHAVPAAQPGELAVWGKLSVYSSQSTTVGGRPLGLEIIRRLRESDALGATNLRGIWGYHGDHPPDGDRLIQGRRRVPVLTVSVDDAQRITRTFAIIDELTAQRGLVTSELVPALQAMSAERTIGGLTLARRSP